MPGLSRETKPSPRWSRLIIELEVDGAITSEGDDDGAFVLAWTWVDFNGTAFDKEAEDDEDEDAEDTD